MLIMATREGRTEVIPQLVKAGAALDLQDNVCLLVFKILMLYTLTVGKHCTDDGCQGRRK